MLPFSVQLHRGDPTHTQILSAVKEAMRSGQLRDGDPFPSIRELTQSLRISPKAAQTVVAQLQSEGLLATQSGSGFMVRLGTVTLGAPSTEASPTALPTVIDPTEAPSATVATPWPFLTQLPGQPNLLGTLDHYEVERLLAKGGMGLVFAARDANLDRHVAIKVLAPHLATSQRARTRFLREARALAALDHENILPVHSVGESKGTPYLVMPLVKGESLQARLDREGPLPVSLWMEVSLKLARGLAAAHAQGLIHRDLKPDNVLLESLPGKRVWIADFGLARARQDQDLTGTGILAATPKYASPEQINGDALTPTSDLFSLGATLYTAITGKPPFAGSHLGQLLHNIVEAPPIPPHRLRPGLPAEVDRLILQLLEKAPERRPAKAADIVVQLENLLQEP
jgi:serine/threonine-protein kinase